MKVEASKNGWTVSRRLGLGNLMIGDRTTEEIKISSVFPPEHEEKRP